MSRENLKKWDVEIGASNRIRAKFDRLDDVRDFLENCQGRLSLVNNYIGHEVFNGYVSNWVRMYDNDLIRKEA